MTSAYKLLRVLLLILWPPSVLASGLVTLDQTIQDVRVGVWVIIMVLSTMGGLTSLLHRLKSDIPDRLFTYVLSHMLMAWFVGGTAFFLMENINTPDLLEIPMIAVVSYSGARLMDSVTEKVSKWLDGRLDKLLG